MHVLSVRMKHFLLLFSLAFSVVSVRAGNDNIPIGARSSALANTSVTLSDVWSVHHNQGGMGFLRNAAAGTFFESRFMMPELALTGAVAAVPTSKGTFGISIRNFGYKLYSESKIGLAYGRSFGKNLGVGIQLNYQNARFAETYGAANIFTAEIGAVYKLSPELTIGAHLYNPAGSRLTREPLERLPGTMRLGLRYNFTERIFIAAETEKDSYSKAVLRAALEYQIVDVFVVRAGISGNPANSSFGFGLKLKKLTFDFAGSFHPNLGFTPQASLNWQFSKS